jgi:exonuclease III
MDYPRITKRDVRCPAATPYLCGTSTISRGLCVADPAECSIRAPGPRPFPTIAVAGADAGAAYGYIDAFLGQHSYVAPADLTIDYEARFSDGEPVPPTFSLLNYNMWGLARKESQRRLFRLRKDFLQATIADTGADIICLQEMSAFAFHEMRPFIESYKFASEIPYPATEVERNRSVDTYCLSRYKPSRVVTYGIPGVLGYSNCFTILEFPNLVVINLYSQAGSKYSPGQGSKWIHYARARYDILESIYHLIIRDYSTISVILCGDFNCDLDGSNEEWPELEMMQMMKDDGFKDTFRYLYPDEPGYTEDTDLNHMRWNQKLMYKQYRYDAILYRRMGLGHWVPQASRIIGTESAYLNAADSAWFLAEVSEAEGPALLHGVAADADGQMILPINPSDHFGVLTQFGTPVRRFTRKNRNRNRRTLKRGTR